MSEFCGCMDNQGVCGHMKSPYFLDACPIHIDEWCPTGCNNPVFDDDEEYYDEEYE